MARVSRSRRRQGRRLTTEKHPVAAPPRFIHAKPLRADALLGALADNGVPTLTHALPSGGPAYGSGNNLLHLASDQRGSGFARSTAGATDIGAFQTGDGIFSSGFE